MEQPKPAGAAPSTPRKLDTMSQEDLVKYSKKQMMLLQKLKAKCDELQNKLKTQADYEETKQKCIKFKKIIDENTKEKDDIVQSQNQLKKEKNAITEEFDCFKMKQETLLVTLQCLQEDHDKISSENKTTLLENTNLKQKIEELENRDVDQQDYVAQIEDKSRQLIALKDHIKTMKSTQVKLEKNNEQLVKENSEAKAEISAAKISLDMFKSKASCSDNTLKTTNEKLAKLETEFHRMQSENSSLNNDLKKLHNIESEYQSLGKDFETVEREKRLADKDLENAKTEFQTKLNEIEILKKQHQENENILQAKISELENEKVILKKEITTVNPKLEQATQELSDLKTELSSKDQAITKEINALKEKFGKVDEENKELTKINVEYEAKAKESCKITEEDKCKINDVTLELKQKETQISEIKNLLEAKTTDCENLAVKIEQQEINVISLQEKLEENLKIVQQGEDCKAQENVELKSQLLTLKLELEKLKKGETEYQTLTTEFESLKTEKLESENQKAEIKSQLASKLAELEDLQKQQQEASENYEIKILKIKNSKEVAEEEVNKLSSQLELANQEISDLKAKFSSDDQTLNDEIIFLKEKIDKVDQEKAKLTEENQQHENQVTESCQLLKEEKDKNVEILTQLKQKETELCSLQNNFSLKLEECENLTQKCQEMQDQLSTVQHQLEEKSEIIQETQNGTKDEIENLKMELEQKSELLNAKEEIENTFKLEIKNLTKAIEESKEKLKDLNETNEELVLEISGAKNLSESLQSEVLELKSSKQKMKSEFEERNLKNQSVINKLQEQIDSGRTTEENQHEDEIKEKEKLLQEFAESKQQLEAELNETRKACTDIKLKLNESEQKDVVISEVKQKLDEVTAENLTFKQKIETTVIEIDSLTEKLSKMSEFEDKYTNSESEKNSLNKELSEKSYLLDQLTIQLNKTSEINDKLSKETETYKKEIEDQELDFNNKIESKEKKIQKLGERILTLNATTIELNEVLEKSKTEKNDLQSEVESMQLELKNLATQQEGDLYVKKEFNILQDIEKELNLKLAEVNTQLETLKSENLLLKEEVDLNETNKVKQNTEKFDTEKEIMELKDSKTFLENKFSELQTKFEYVSSDLNTEVTENSKLKDEISRQKQTLLEELNQTKDELQTQLDQNAQSTEKFTNLEQLKSENEDKFENLKSEFAEKQKNFETTNQELTLKLETLEKKWVELEKNSAIERTAETSDNKQIDSLQKSIKEKDTYSSKLKMIAVKAKKELDATKIQLQSQIEENNKLQGKIKGLESSLMGSQTQASNVQMMQIECDKLQDQLDQIIEEKSALQKNIEELFTQLSTTQTEKANLKSNLDIMESNLEKSVADNLETEKKLTQSKSNYLVLDNEKEGIVKQKNQLIKEIDALKIQVSNLSKNLNEKEKKYEESQQSLSFANKNLKQNDLLSLEITEYEKTINDLHIALSDLESLKQNEEEKGVELEKQIVELQTDRSHLEQLRQEAELRVTRTKEMLDGARDDIEKLSSNEIKLNSELQDSQQQTEVLQQENEQLKLDLSQKVSECRISDEQISSLKNSHDLNLDIMERKLKATQADLLSYKNEKERLSVDYENYKVRVHSVLKQQKSKESKNQTPELNTELIAFRQKVDQVQLKLLETQNILTSRDGELDLLQGDYDRLLRQQQQSTESATEREGRWKSRVKSLQQELVSLRKQHSELQKKMTELNETCVSNEEVTTLKHEHDGIVESLNGQLAKRENEIFKLKSELKDISEEKRVTVSSTPKKLSIAIPPPARSSDHYLTSSITGLDFRGVDREEGEGEENPDQPPAPSFEQILQSPTEIKSVKLLSETQSMTSEVNLKYLETKFEAQTKQLEHLTEVARENEATSARLIDQNKVLKDEIRRLEKNQERENSVSNMEYLKNVIYKFVTLPPCEERKHLLPVIDTMLKFNEVERRSLQHIAIGDDGAGDQDMEGWGSYLQRWSGM